MQLGILCNLKSFFTVQTWEIAENFEPNPPCHFACHCGKIILTFVGETVCASSNAVVPEHCLKYFHLKFRAYQQEKIKV